jgi:amidohydrolase
MVLSSQDIVDLIGWRRKLHSQPELSGEESGTAQEVRTFLAPTGPDSVVSCLGGEGVAVIYEGAGPGPTVMFRAELDALPIEELSGAPYRSQVAGKAHLCGHDGHMTILAAVARGFGRERPRTGRIVLLFQPAEENEAGAAAVIADAQFAEVAPDYVRPAQRPGIPLGEVALREGIVNCASRGMRVVLSGTTAHASRPETGTSPMQAVAGLMPALTALFRRRPVG